MTFKMFTIFVATAALSACGRGPEETAKPAPAASTTAEAPHKEEPNTVEVDEGMLRDLRITTRAVESRTGGDLVMLLGELRRALVSGELELHHQPAIDAATGRISSVEGLLVWRHPSLGLLGAHELTEMVDLSNLNADIVLYSLREAVAHYTAWQRAGKARTADRQH